MADEKIIESFYTMWNNFPGMVRLIQKDKTVVAVNRAAADAGFTTGVRCIDSGPIEGHAGCLANKALSEKKGMSMLAYGGKMTRYWVPVEGCADLYVHFVLFPQQAEQTAAALEMIKQVIQLYFDASYNGDADKMAQVFHPAAHIYGHGPDGALMDMDKSSFVSLIGSFPTDAAAPRDDKIISIDLTGESTAVARVSLRAGNTLFTDILSFVQLDGSWSVISKLYSGVQV